MMRISMSLLAWLSVLALHGQDRVVRTDTTEYLDINFRFDKDVFERDYMTNRSSLEKLHAIFEKDIAKCVDSIVVIAASSPEGGFHYNLNLARRRADGIKRYFLWQFPEIDESLIQTQAIGENWMGLQKLIAQDAQMPHQDEVLQIIERNINPDRKELLIQQLGSGAAWRYIEEQFLDQLRTGATCVLYYKEEYLRDLQMQQLTLRNLPMLKNEVVQPNHGITFDKINNNILPLDNSSRIPLFAFKTNLLANAFTSINIELEVPIGDRWSVGAEWMFPWWIFQNNRYYNQLLMGTLEGRYWWHTIKQQACLSGHALGLYVSAGYYDFQWLKTGYQGEILPTVGLSYTYAHQLGTHFRLEYSLGMGIVNTKYRKYTANDQYDQFPWLSSGRTLWIGPTKAEVSFVWLISKKRRDEKK